MRRIWLSLVLVVAVAGTAYALTYYLNSRRTEDQWTWLRREFHLNAVQVARIKALQQAYQPVCMNHCNRIMAVQARLDSLTSAGRKDTPEYLTALNDWEAIKHECNEATFKHLQDVAAVMSPPQGRRYLAMMVPRIMHFDHLGPMGIR